MVGKLMYILMIINKTTPSKDKSFGANTAYLLKIPKVFKPKKEENVLLITKIFLQNVLLFFTALQFTFWIMHINILGSLCIQVVLTSFYYI